MRIVSICPSNTEMIEALRLTDQLVAVDDYSDWPSAVETLPRLGPDLNINIERLETFKPDLVLSSLSVPGMEKNVQALDRRNIPQLVLNPQSFQDICQDLLKIGQRLKVQEVAHEVVEQLEQRIHYYRTVTKRSVQKSNVFIGNGGRNLFIHPGKGTGLRR